MTGRSLYGATNLSLGLNAGWLVQDVTFELSPGDTVGLFGSSGSGKSTIVRALANQLSESIVRRAGTVSVPSSISLVQQNPFLSFNPVISVGEQISEVFIRGMSLGKEEAKQKVIELLSSFGFVNPAIRYRDFSLQFSGGELQRIAVAKALAFDPSLLVLDEATSALDEDNQELVFDAVAGHQKSTGCAVLVVSHSLELIRQRCSYGVFLEAGEILERGPLPNLLQSPSSPRLQKLVAARKSFTKALAAKASDQSILDLAGVRVFNPDSPASELVSISEFRISRGESLGIVAASGSGKSSLLKGILGCYPAKLARVRLSLQSGEFKAVSRQAKKSFGYVLQDPRDSFDPRRTISSSLKFAYRGKSPRVDFADRLTKVFQDVGLEEGLSNRLPSQLSGGQLQRASIARALINNPEVIFLDEPTSALDQENEVLVLELLQLLRQKYGLTIVLISHSSFVTEAATDRVISL